MVMRMRMVAIALIAAFAAGCDATVHKTTTIEYDPFVLAQANYWTGLFWLALPICAVIGLTAWAIAYAVSERAKYQLDQRQRADRDRSL